MSYNKLCDVLNERFEFLLQENVNENMNKVLAFSSRFQPEGPPFYKVIKTVARSLVNETALQVTVIETEHFPMVSAYT